MHQVVWTSYENKSLPSSQYILLVCIYLYIYPYTYICALTKYKPASHTEHLNISTVCVNILTTCNLTNRRTVVHIIYEVSKQIQNINNILAVVVVRYFIVQSALLCIGWAWRTNAIQVCILNVSIHYTIHIAAHTACNVDFIYVKLMNNVISAFGLCGIILASWVDQW